MYKYVQGYLYFYLRRPTLNMDFEEHTVWPDFKYPIPEVKDIVYHLDRQVKCLVNVVFLSGESLKDYIQWVRI